MYTPKENIIERNIGRLLGIITLLKNDGITAQEITTTITNFKIMDKVTEEGKYIDEFMTVKSIMEGDSETVDRMKKYVTANLLTSEEAVVKFYNIMDMMKDELIKKFVTVSR